MNDRLAALESVLPAESVALTEKVCRPSARFVRTFGGEHGVQPPASSLHSKLEASVEENSKLATFEVIVPEGPEVIDVSGGVVSTTTASTVHVRVAGDGSTLPAASFALTENVCAPDASPAAALGDEQADQSSASSLHSKPEPGSVEENSKDAVLEVVVPAGPKVIKVSGGVVSGTVVSTVHVRVAGEASMLPAESVARTEKV